MILSKIKILKSNAGHYIGRTCIDDKTGLVEPYSRLSAYFKAPPDADIDGLYRKSVFICHNKDADGFMSMVIATLAGIYDYDDVIGYNYETEGVDWVDNPEALQEYYNIYFIDVTPPIEWLLTYSSWFNNIIIIDHHQPKLETIKSYNFENVEIVDETFNFKCVSGCTLAYEYFDLHNRLKNKEFERFVENIGYYDTWNWINLEKFKQVNILWGNQQTYIDFAKIKLGEIRKSKDIKEFCRNWYYDNEYLKSLIAPQSYQLLLEDEKNEYLQKLSELKPIIIDNNIVYVFEGYPKPTFQFAIDSLSDATLNGCVFLFRPEDETDKTRYSVRTFDRCNRTAIDFIRKYGLSSDGGHKHSGVIHLNLNQYKDEGKTNL